jgi:hypothetical protein
MPRDIVGEPQTPSSDTYALTTPVFAVHSIFGVGDLSKALCSHQLDAANFVNACLPAMDAPSLNSSNMELYLSQHHRRVIGKVGQIDCCCRRRSRQPSRPLISCVAPLLSSSFSRIHQEFMNTSSQELRRIPGMLHVADSRS